MPPKSPPPEQPELFRSALANLVDRRHPLVRLAGLIDWERFAAAFGPLYRDGGRPGLRTRLMVGLHLIKHMDGLSDEAVCARFLDSPYVQLFCGETHFQHALPLDRSSMTRWRKRIGAEQLELLLAETLAAAQRAGAAEPKHFERVTIDTTVQPKAVTHPTDSKLLHRGVEILSRLARRHGIALRQSYTRVSTRARREVAKTQGLPRYEIVQPAYNLYDRRDFEESLAPVIQEEGLGAVSYFSLASGFLSGKYSSKADLEGSSRKGFLERYFDERGERILAALREVSQELKAPVVQLALAWLLSRPGLTAPIASATSLAQLDEILAAVDLDLPEDARDRLDAASR